MKYKPLIIVGVGVAAYMFLPVVHQWFYDIGGKSARLNADASNMTEVKADLRKRATVARTVQAALLSGLAYVVVK